MSLPLNYIAFTDTLVAAKPPDHWPTLLKALWYDAKGDWHAAHDIADGMSDSMAIWIHAYLHRKEGDEWNAKYWYRQANMPFTSKSFDEEHQELVAYILANSST